MSLPETAPAERSRGSRLAAIAAAGSLALFAGIETGGTAVAEAHAKDPAIERINHQVDLIGQQSRLMLEEGVMDVYKERVPSPNGGKSKFWRIVGSTPSISFQTGKEGFTQLITTFKDGHNRPESIALFINTDTKKYEYGEPYEEMRIFLREFNSGGDMTMQDAFLDRSTNTFKNEYFDKHNGKFYHQFTDRTRIKVDEKTVVMQYQSLLEQAEGAAKFLLGNPKKPKHTI